MPTEIPKNVLPVLLKILEKHGSLAPQKIIEKDPGLAFELLAALQGLDLSPDLLQSFLGRMNGPPAPSGKRKRRR